MPFYHRTAKLVTCIDSKVSRIYYSLKGYWKGITAVKKLPNATKVSDAVAEYWLKKQAIWQIYLPPPRFIPRPKFDEERPNAVHQAGLLFLPHDHVGRKTYRYCLCIADVASRFKAAEPLTDKSAASVAEALSRIYKRGSLTWPSLLQVDAGNDFKGPVSVLLASHRVSLRRVIPGNHRQQCIVERFNRTLSERLFGYQYGEKLTSLLSEMSNGLLDCSLLLRN